MAKRLTQEQIARKVETLVTVLRHLQPADIDEVITSTKLRLEAEVSNYSQFKEAERRMRASDKNLRDTSDQLLQRAGISLHKPK